MERRSIKLKKIDIYSILIIIATCFMGIAYASIIDINASIGGYADATPQNEVFVTDVVSKDVANSKINHYFGTMVDSEIKLEDNENSTVTYDVTVYNSSTVDYMFVGVVKDELNEDCYTNDNIKYTLSNIQERVTIIEPKASLTFTVTFEYNNKEERENQILKSKLNYRFKPAPVFELDRNDEEIELTGLYPGCEPVEYTFNVMNFNETKINAVPMTYTIVPTIDAPLTAKIYKDEEEITQPISIAANGEQKETHTYTLKIMWDETNAEENIDYNSIDYSNKEFTCNLQVIATPSSDKYLKIGLIKEFNVNILTAPFYFENELQIDRAENYLEFSNSRAESNLTVITSDEEENKNTYNTTYKISLHNNENLVLYINDEQTENNEATLEITPDELTQIVKIEIMATDGTYLDIEENCTIKVETISPYKKEKEYNIVITRDLGINPSILSSEMIPIKYENGWIQANQNISGDWFDYGYKKWANIETDNGYFVYIPRFAYKIMSGYHEPLTGVGKIAIVFLNEDNTIKTVRDSEGNKVNQSDIVHSNLVDSGEANTGINATTKYIIHPAFTAFDTASSNVDGIWVAKYEMSMESTSNGGSTWSHRTVSSTSTGNILTTSDTTKRMVSKPGVSTWRYIDVTNIFDNCYNMNRNLDSHMMKNTEWGAINYLAMSKYGQASTREIQQNTSSSYLTGYGTSGVSTGLASTTGDMTGVFDLNGGSYEYVAAYLNDTCLSSSGSLYSINKSLVTAASKYKDVYEETYSTKVGDAMWEISANGTTWWNDEFYFAGLLNGSHYPIFDRGGTYNTASSSSGSNYTGRNNGENHPGVTFRAVIIYN